MTTLQEQFEKDFPDKGAENISIAKKYQYFSFTNYDLDLSEYENLEKLNLGGLNLTSLKLGQCKKLIILELAGNKLTSVDFLNSIPNPEKLEKLYVYDNKIQPTDIEAFSKFVNLKDLKVGDTLGEKERNQFCGSLKAYQNLTKLEAICIEATDVNEGLEYLPESLTKATQGGWYGNIECSPHNTQAKCKAIQDQLRPFNYDLEAWQLAHPDKMLKVWKEKYEDKQKLISELETKITQTQQELNQTKIQEADKTKKITRLEQKLKLLEETKTKLENELFQEQQQHNQTKTNFQSQLRDLATILFPSHPNLSNLSFADLKEKAEKTVKEKEGKIQTLENQLAELTNIIFPNQELNFTNLKKEIQKLKVQDLTPQLKTKRTQLAELITKLNQKVGSNLEKVLKLYLETYISMWKEKKENNTFSQGQLTAYENILTEKLSKIELQNFLQLQKAALELEEQLNNFVLEAEQYKTKIEVFSHKII